MAANNTEPVAIVPIAGDFTATVGGSLDPKWTRLKDSPSHADREKEGLRLEMNGGKYEQKAQKAIFEFLCIPKGDEKEDRMSILDDEEDDGDDDGEEDKSGEEVDDGSGGRIKYLSWEDEQDSKAKVLRLEWRTQHACEDAASDKKNRDSSAGGHWGFFTWLILM